MYKNLQVISKIKFSKREIDTIACIISGNSAKATAQLLYISYKTVETHTQNILKKIDGHAKSNIIQFVQNSPKYDLLKAYYSELLKKEYFEKLLNQINITLQTHNKPTYKFIDLQQFQNNFDKKSLRLYFQRVGIRTNQQAKSYKIYLLDKGGVVQFLKNNTTSSLISDKAIFIFMSDVEVVPDEIKGTNHIFFGHDIYLTFFQVIKFLILHVSLDPFRDTFKIKFTNPYTFRTLTDPTQNIGADNNFSLKSYLSILAIISFCIIFFEASYYFIKTSILQSEIIHLNFLLPHKTNFINRKELIQCIHQKFKNKDDINIVVLTGIGGAGKTTLARQYALSQNASIVWELNAETFKSFVESLEQFATSATQTQTEKNEVKIILNTKNDKERMKELIRFTEKKLKEQRSWFLIFDNVEQFTVIKSFFLCDAKIWKKGKILITTRNIYFKNNIHLNPNNFIDVQALSNKEKFDLFTKIAPLIDRNDKEKTVKFLKKIPSFPLDVSVAAHYIKNTQTPCQNYLEKVHANQGDVQKKFLVTVSEYPQTRYDIVAITTQKIIKECPKFAELLLLISMLDSQDIPLNLLRLYHDKAVIDDFMYNLKKHSLITKQSISSKKSVLTFSIHREIQKIFLRYVHEVILKGKDKKELFNKIIALLETYTKLTIEMGNISNIRILLRHLKVLIDCPYLDQSNKAIIKILVGKIYYHVGSTYKAQSYLDPVLTNLCQRYPDRNNLYIPAAMVQLGMISREMGNFKKSQKFLEASIKIYNKFFRNNYDEIAWAYFQLGRTHIDLSNCESGQFCIQKGIDIYIKYYGPMCQKLSWGYLYFGDIYRDLGNYKKSEYFYRKSLLIYKKNHVSNYIEVANLLTRIADVLKSMGQFSEAKKLFKASYRIYQSQCPENFNRISLNLTRLGDIYRSIGCCHMAQNKIEQSLKISEKYYGENHIKTAWRELFIGILLLDEGKFDKALFVLEKVLKMHVNKFGAQHKKIFWIESYIANAHKYLGNFTQSATLFEKVLQAYEKYYGAQHIETARILCDFGHFYLMISNSDKSESMIKKALSIFQENTHPDSYLCLEYLADLYYKQSASLHLRNKQHAYKLKKQSLDSLKQALDIATAHFPKDSKHIARLKAKFREYTALYLSEKAV